MSHAPARCAWRLGLVRLRPREPHPPGMVSCPKPAFRSLLARTRAKSTPPQLNALTPPNLPVGDFLEFPPLALFLTVSHSKRG